jgi:membrane protease YdiL (CAAX protease family)
MLKKPGTRLAVAFEGGLILVAVLLAALITHWLDLALWERITPTAQDVPAAIARGLLATVPMLAAFFAMFASHLGPFVRLRHQVIAMVCMVLGGASIADLALVAILAGVGEELLFRGVLQPVAVHFTNPWFGIAIASILFGLAHSLSWLYFLLATLIGAYFGWLADAYDEVLSPAVAHALYDFVALVWVLKRKTVQHGTTATGGARLS